MSYSFKKIRVRVSRLKPRVAQNGARCVPLIISQRDCNDAPPCTRLADTPPLDDERVRHGGATSIASLENLEDLLQDELKDRYDAELTKALPKLAKKATARELNDAFDAHLRETEQHIKRIEQAFEHPTGSGRSRGVEATPLTTNEQ
jgi:hypothetical protein